MAQQYFNPFSGLTLVYPVEQGPDYQRYCQTAARASIDESPFPRMVDMWFAALSLAAHLGLSPADLTGKQTSNMTPGSIFDGPDSWRVQVVMLIAIAVDEKVDIVADPIRMMAIANGLAAAGIPNIVQMLQDGGQVPIWNLSEALENVLSEDPE